MPKPLPFRLGSPGRDTIDLEGIISVSYRLDGLLHLTDQGIALEWIETRTMEQVSLEKIGTDVDEVATDILEVPMARLAGAWVIGGWWWPQLELRARGFQDFEEVPGARGVSLPLRIHRRDRALARAIAGEIQAGAAAQSGLPRSGSPYERG